MLVPMIYILGVGAAHGADHGGGRRRGGRPVAQAQGRGGALVQGKSITSGTFHTFTG